MLNRIALGLLAAVALLHTPLIQAQATDRSVSEYPAKPIRFIVTFSPGGGTDTFARAVAQKLSATWGQPVIVDNRGGAGGNIGANIVAQSPNDGYTIVFTTNATMSINPLLYKLPFDPVRDFSPISQLATVPFVLLVHPGVPAKSVTELVAHGKAQNGRLSYASSGLGGGSHLSAELLKKMGNFDMIHVPYKGGATGLIDTIGGHVQAMFSTVLTGRPHIRANRLRGLAVTGPKRSPVLPEVPALNETRGFEQFETDLWYGMLAPAKTDRRIVDKIYQETKRALAQPDLRKRFEPSGAQVIASSPAEFAATMKSESKKWKRIIQIAGIKSERAQ